MEIRRLDCTRILKKDFFLENANEEKDCGRLTLVTDDDKFVSVEARASANNFSTHRLYNSSLLFNQCMANVVESSLVALNDGTRKQSDRDIFIVNGVKRSYTCFQTHCHTGTIANAVVDGEKTSSSTTNLTLAAAEGVLISVKAVVVGDELSLNNVFETKVLKSPRKFLEAETVSQGVGKFGPTLDLAYDNLLRQKQLWAFLDSRKGLGENSDENFDPFRQTTRRGIVRRAKRTAKKENIGFVGQNLENFPVLCAGHEYNGHCFLSGTAVRIFTSSNRQKH
uniref:Uncharacterized protein n=1 Tax=Romanomermis culicivorax TaxID=13658 RepID=A0A915I9Y9_ROMCU